MAVDPMAAAQRAEDLLDGLEAAVERAGADTPSLALWQAVGRVAHASNALWHTIGNLRSDATRCPECGFWNGCNCKEDEDA